MSDPRQQPASAPGPEAESDALRERVARLERINAALMDRVERAVDGSDSAYAIFQSNLVLRQAIRERTAELAGLNTSLQQEVAERRRSEDAMRDAQRIGRLGSWTCELSTGEVRWSRQLFDLFGRSEADGPPGLDKLADDYAPGCDTRLRRALHETAADGRPFSLCLRTRRGHDGVRHVRTEGRAQFDEHGAIVGLHGTVADVTEAIEREAALAEITTALDVANDCVFIFDARTLRFVYANQGATTQVGWTTEELQAVTPVQIMAELDETGFRELLGPLRRTPGTSLVLRTEHQHRDGARIPVEVSLQFVPELGPEGRFVSIVRDITGQLAAERGLEAARRNAEAANLAKSEFLANMSHEIRTPMTAILGFAGLLQDDPAMIADPAEAADAVGRIRSNAEHLLAIVNDILDVSKIEAGRMTLERISCDPLTIAEEVVNLLECRATAKGLRLLVEAPEPTPARITSDPTRLRQILLNLVGNAIKFTTTGSVTVRLACEAENELMSFAVRDTGIGMTAAQADQIARFDAFSQADTSTTREFGGTGLGLRISSALATMLGGGIGIDSAPGGGSTFTACVGAGDLDGATMRPPMEPLLAPTRTAGGERERARSSVRTTDDPTPAAAMPLDGVHVLLAEDGPDNQRLVGFLLRKAGARVSIVENGQLAMDAVRTTTGDDRPDLILMDMQMPVMDGYDATRELRAGGESLPIIALTAHAMAEDRDRCLAAGCDDYLTKPVDRTKLIEQCRRWATAARRVA